jgi:hypothetical protein
MFSVGATGLHAQKSVPCRDGDHILIDLKTIALQYDASSFSTTLNGLSVLHTRLEVNPKRLQEAAAATQQWNEFLKGLVSGYNSCAITSKQYAEGLNRIYPRLKEDAADLEAIRKAISAGQKAESKRLEEIVASYYVNLTRFASISTKDILLEQISALATDVAGVRRDTQAILAELPKLAQTTPQERDRISGLINSLCNRGVLSEPYEWEMRKEVYVSLSQIREQIDGVLTTLPADSPALGPLKRIQRCARQTVQDPAIFPDGPKTVDDPRPRPVADVQIEAIVNFRKEVSSAIADLQHLYDLVGHCNFDEERPSNRWNR